MSRRTADRRCGVWLVTKNDSLASLARLEKPCRVTAEGSMPQAARVAVSGCKRSTGTRVVRIDVWVVRVRAVAKESVAMATVAAIMTWRWSFIGNGLCGTDCRCRRPDKSWRNLWAACPHGFQDKWICL